MFCILKYSNVPVFLFFFFSCFLHRSLFAIRMRVHTRANTPTRRVYICLCIRICVIRVSGGASPHTNTERKGIHYVQIRREAVGSVYIELFWLFIFVQCFIRLMFCSSQSVKSLFFSFNTVVIMYMSVSKRFHQNSFMYSVLTILTSLLNNVNI